MPAHPLGHRRHTYTVVGCAVFFYTGCFQSTLGQSQGRREAEVRGSNRILGTSIGQSLYLLEMVAWPVWTELAWGQKEQPPVLNL